MRILHTSDIHLSEDKPETISALEEVLRVADEQSVDIITVGGDLFDSEEDAEALRSELRRKFSNNKFEILAIPGNHDRRAYAQNLDFGSDITVVTEEPFKVISKGDTSITALPFTERPTKELLSNLREATEQPVINVLLLHCTLDIGFSTGDFGEEAYKYFPISIATLGRLGYDYILAGHFHKTTYIRPLPQKGVFIYPGSPVSHTKKETGKRNVVLIDVGAEKYSPVSLHSFYHDSYMVTVRPGWEEWAVKNIQEWVEARRKDVCSLEIIVDGFIEKDEKEFRNKIESLVKGIKVIHRYRNVTVVLEHPLFDMFKKNLAEKDIDQKEEVEDRVIDAMARLLRTRELRA